MEFVLCHLRTNIVSVRLSKAHHFLCKEGRGEKRFRRKEKFFHNFREETMRNKVLRRGRSESKTSSVFREESAVPAYTLRKSLSVCNLCRKLLNRISAERLISTYHVFQAPSSSQNFLRELFLRHRIYITILFIVSKALSQSSIKF